MAGTRKIDWLNHFLEFIVVIIGILIAFQLNNSRERNNEQKLVDQHLTNILAESEFNKKMLSSAAERSQQLLQQLDSLTALLKQENKHPATLNNLSMSLLSLDYLYLKKNAYNTLVETGDIRFIEDFELQNEIVEIYEFYKWLEGIETSTYQTYGDQYFPYVVENLDLSEYQPQEVAVYDNKRFKNYLSTYSYSLQYRYKKQQDILLELDDFITFLKIKHP